MSVSSGPLIGMSIAKLVAVTQENIVNNLDLIRALQVFNLRFVCTVWYLLEFLSRLN